APQRRRGQGGARGPARERRAGAGRDGAQRLLVAGDPRVLQARRRPARLHRVGEQAMSQPAALLLATAHLKGPHVDFAGLSPLIALLGGATVVLLAGLLGPRWVRAQLVPSLALAALAAALGLTIWQWGAHKSIVS